MSVSVSARVTVLLLVAAGPLHGQVLDGGSDGSDGALTLATPGDVIFDPLAMGLDPDRDNVFHFTSITVGPGVVLRMPVNALQGAPVIWLATGAVQVDGSIELNGRPGSAA